LACAVFAVLGASVTHAQNRGNAHNILLLDNCEEEDSDWDAVGGCPEGGAPGLQSYDGDVTLDEFLELLTSPLTPAGHIVGHPSWRIDPSYITIQEGQALRVKNLGGRTHTFTEVEEFGGGFVGDLNGDLETAPECGAVDAPASDVVFIVPRRTVRIRDNQEGVEKYQCCIHPWMRFVVRVEE
jgi:hypothetical protein